jgi:hypothetical protein
MRASERWENTSQPIEPPSIAPLSGEAIGAGFAASGTERTDGSGNVGSLELWDLGTNQHVHSVNTSLCGMHSPDPETSCVPTGHHDECGECAASHVQGLECCNPKIPREERMRQLANVFIEMFLAASANSAESADRRVA